MFWMQTQSISARFGKNTLGPHKDSWSACNLTQELHAPWTHLPLSALSLKDARLCVREEALVFLDGFVQACFG